MKRCMVTWVCPRCGSTEAQPASVKSVSHLCGKGQRLVRLEREVPGPS